MNENSAMAHAMEKISELAKEPLGYLGAEWAPGVHVETIVVTWIVMLILIIAAVVISRNFSVIPGKLQAGIEAVYEFFEELADNFGGERVKKYLPLLITFFIFISASNLWGLLPAVSIPLDGFKCSNSSESVLILTMPPTRDLNTTLALALLSFLAFQIIGYKEGGIKYFSHYLHPLDSVLAGLPKSAGIICCVPLALFFIFINIIEEVARVASLTMRLMGNILGEHIVTGIMVGLLYVACAFAPNAIAGFFFTAGTDVFAFALQFMGVLTGIVQGFVFTILTLSYIGSAVEIAEGH